MQPRWDETKQSTLTLALALHVRWSLPASPAQPASASREGGKLRGPRSRVHEARGGGIPGAQLRCARSSRVPSSPQHQANSSVPPSTATQGHPPASPAAGWLLSTSASACPSNAPRPLGRCVRSPVPGPAHAIGHCAWPCPWLCCLGLPCNRPRAQSQYASPARTPRPVPMAPWPHARAAAGPMHPGHDPTTGRSTVALSPCPSIGCEKPGTPTRAAIYRRPNKSPGRRVRLCVWN